MRGGLDEESAELERLEVLADKLPAGKLTGSIVDFPIADGKALYLVTSERPLTLQHIPFWDGYSIPPAHIRGLDKQDLLAVSNYRKAWRKLLASKVQN